MADNDTDTTTGETPTDASNTDASGAGSDAGTEDVSLLRSRYAGQTAKVNTLTEANKAAIARADAAEKRLADYEAGKVSADETLKSQVAAKDAELAQVRKEAALARIEAKYPETFAVLGEVAASLSAEKLAESEARLGGEGFSPTPLRHNESRTTSPKGEQKAETADDVKARLLSMPNPWG